MAKAAGKEKATNEFSEYRHKLVVERKTIWPKEIDLPAGDRDRFAAKLHAKPQDAAIMSYVRCPTGFVQLITVTADDITRIGKG